MFKRLFERRRSVRFCLSLALTLSLSLAGLACSSDEPGADAGDAADVHDISEAALPDARPDSPDMDEEDIPAVVPPRPLDALSFQRPVRTASGTPPSQAEIAAFTDTMASFFFETGYFDWAWRNTHGLDASYDANMMDYKLWWQDVGMRKQGDTVVFYHHGRAENIAERTVKVLPNLIGGYLATGNQRLADLSTQLMKGMVALSLGLEFEREDPIIK